jgi:hypothetical protein
MGDHLAGSESVAQLTRSQEHNLPQECAWPLVGAAPLAGQSLDGSHYEDKLSQCALECVREQLQVPYETEHVHAGAE